jgi:hypothetical protein
VTVTRASYSNSGWKYTFATALVGKQKARGADVEHLLSDIVSRAAFNALLLQRSKAVVLA